MFNFKKKEEPSVVEKYVSWGTKIVDLGDAEFSNDFWTADYNNVKFLTKGQKVLFIDIGANEGQSVKKAYHFFDDVKVISYEPLKSCSEKLNALKEKYSNFEWFNVAMSGSKEKVTIYECAESGLSSALMFDDSYSYHGTTNKDSMINSCLVQTTTFREEWSVWKKYGDIRVLKIDTQGTELGILKNGADILASGSIHIIMIEIMTVNKYINQGSYVDLLKFFDENGFVLYTIRPIYREINGKTVDPCGFDVGQDTEYDAIFVHKDFLRKRMAIE